MKIPFSAQPETPEGSSSTNTCPLNPGSAEHKKGFGISRMSQSWYTWGILDHSGRNKRGENTDKWSSSILFLFFFSYLSQNRKKWHGLNFYNVLFSFVRRKFSSLGAKSREIKSVFRQLNKRLNYQKQQYPVFSSCYQKRLRSYFIFKRVFSNSKKKTFLFAKHSHRKHPSGNEGQEANWKTTIKFFPFTVQLLATGNRQDGFSSNGTTVIKGLMLSCSSIPLQWRVEPKLLPMETRKSRDSQCLCLLLSLFLCFALWSENLALAAVFTPSLNPPSDSNQLNTAWPNFFSPSKPGGAGH